MSGRIQSGPRRYDYIIVFFIIMLVSIITIVILIPQQVIIDVASSLVEFAVVLIVFTIFKFMFPMDKSNRQRVKGGPYGSVFITQNMFCFAAIGTVLMLVFYHFIIHPGVVLTITDYVQQAGQLSGVGLILGAMLFVTIMGYQLLQSMNYRTN
ncbi:MAG: hypothetical protein ACTSWA_13630 [Candidatus Thorarchaeota archaeon]